MREREREGGATDSERSLATEEPGGVFPLLRLLDAHRKEGTSRRLATVTDAWGEGLATDWLGDTCLIFELILF